MLAHLIAIDFFGEGVPAPIPPVEYGFDDPGPLGDIIYRALRRIGAINARATLSPLQATQALSVLKTLIRQLPNSWFNVTGAEGYVCGEDERVTLDTSVLVTLPVYVSLDGTGTADAYDASLHRAPRDGAKIQIIDRTTRTSELYIYRADFALWTAISSLSLTSESPFNADLDEPLSAALAMMLAEEYGGEPGLVTQQMALSFLNSQRRRGAPRKKFPLDFPCPTLIGGR